LDWKDPCAPVVVAGEEVHGDLTMWFSVFFRFSLPGIQLCALQVTTVSMMETRTRGKQDATAAHL
jgi:hypothetical protein